MHCTDCQHSIRLLLPRWQGQYQSAAGMDEEAQSGEAAHAAYKGGLAPGLARRLHTFLEVSASPPALPVPALWNSSEAAAEELFR